MCGMIVRICDVKLYNITVQFDVKRCVSSIIIEADHTLSDWHLQLLTRDYNHIRQLDYRLELVLT